MKVLEAVPAKVYFTLAAFHVRVTGLAVSTSLLLFLKLWKMATLVKLYILVWFWY